MKMRLAAMGLGILMAASSAWAHHAFAAEFDVDKPLQLHGKVIKMEWINPHSWIHIAVPDEKTGKVNEWMIECGPPNGLLRRGFTKGSLPPGHRDSGARLAGERRFFRANGSSITLPDGSKLFLGSSNDPNAGK